MSSMLYSFKRNIFPAIITVCVLHLFVFICIAYIFTNDRMDISTQHESAISIQFAVVPESSAAEAFVPQVAETEVSPEPEPVIDSEPQPVVNLPKPKPKQQDKPKYKPKLQPPKSSTASVDAAQGRISENASPVTGPASQSAQLRSGGDSATVVRRVKPSYPALSRRMGEEGRVVLNVLVKADGTAGAVSVKRSSGFPRLDDAASNAVRVWRFEPYKIGGLAADHEYSVVVDFSLTN
ncbi:energy transducer TonB [Desulfovibrio sp. UIB00]|uniref:energy transducer TonB n=1 Tax=Desulfovibrio sp. UIB00 TaxID=2804314 RepID=UPI001F103EBF|nr:energy transducer TonB [Desulfovibrio sp. UIB00]